MVDSMESRLVAQALNYHGQQLQKVWEGERNENELAMLNLKDPNFEIYQQRQKTLSFGDRGKRLKLQQFIAKKADTLYDKTNLDKTNQSINLETGDEEFYATMPGLDSFVVMEKSQRIRNFLESLIVGDVIYAQVMGKSTAGLLLKIICNCSDCPRVVIDLAIKALILNTATVPAVDKKGVTRTYMTNDFVCVAVSEVNVEAERVVAVMNIPPREGQVFHPPLGLIHIEDLPDAYKKAMDNKGQSYDKILESSSGFNNPNNIKYLCDLLGLGNENHSNMVGLRERFPPNEFASELRQVQASKWAFRSVADGIDHFKAGRHTEAFQCLNKALVVDPKNVEGLVARGALYANSGSFKKAIEDFETALKLNQTHANARKYMAETLVALGRSYEDEKKFEEAQKSYENCLAIAPHHKEARNSIEYIKAKMTNPTTISPLEPFKPFETEVKPIEAKKEKKKRKKERKSRSKKRQRWSSSSDSTSSGSSSSSSSDSSSSSSSGSSTRSTSRSPSRKRKHKKDHRPSLSPLSKRMNQCNPPAASSNSQDGMSTSAFNSAGNSSSKDKTNDYDMKVMKFLEQTKDDSDYEDKVRRFLEETARWKKEKEKKIPDIDKSKKKKKKDKKTKDKEDKKSRKKKKKEERKKRKSKDKLERDLEALDRSSPDLEQLESKLSAYHAKVEKKTVLNSRFNSHFNKMPSPPDHSSADKFSDNSRHDDYMRREREKERERDDASKSYHERDTRMQQMPPQQRKDVQRKPMDDMFDHHSMVQHQDDKMPPLDTATLNAKWRAAQAARQNEPAPVGKWQNLHPESKQQSLTDDEMDVKLQRPMSMDKSFGIRKQQHREQQQQQDKRLGPLPPSSPPPPLSPNDTLLKQNTMIKYPTPQAQNKFQSYKDTSSSSTITRSQSPNKYTSSLGGKFQPIGQNNPPEPPGPCPPSKRSKGDRSDSESNDDDDNDDDQNITGDDNNDRRRLSRRRDDSRNSGNGKRLSRERQTRRSRTRSKSGSRSSSGSRSRSVRRSRSRTYSNRRSGSYERKYSRSQSGTYSRSRSRSRSRSYTRSRSRSRSNDRGHYRKRQFRPYNNRGTYYKPRFQGFNHQNHRGGNQNSFQNRNRFYNNNNSNNNQHNNRFNNRNRGNYNNNRGGGGGGQNRGRMNNRGGRYFHNNKPGFRDYRDSRRDFRDRRGGSRDRYSDRSYSPDPMRKVDEAKEKINKMLEGEDGGGGSGVGGAGSERIEQVMPPLPPNKRHDGPLSEGEERDDDDYERWTEADNQDTSKMKEQLTGIISDGRDNFIERMKQRSKNVLIQREAAARHWQII
ncbi:uncharacterized protein DDB_G0290685-like isoform X2 [Aphidius gifuensis]|uniref:uncharacterized protein DDB_G0290685-like isoform X2 n=1 Tax=Aphidius gifuensis TaxID=684658 RepID=UPI001CDD5466|nr:uncharacterized protein DDB_G0290685-like isoform X2 [Aphidius gifuensis]